VSNETCLFVAQEDLERTQINVLAVQAITSLVLSAMTLPTAGNPAISCLEQQPRNKILKALDTRYVHMHYIIVVLLGLEVYKKIVFCRFGRKLSVIRGMVEREIQAMVSKRDNIATHFPYQAWDPVPSLSSSTAGKWSAKDPVEMQNVFFFCRIHDLFACACVSAYSGTLISHEKLLLQINTEREMGNMDYKLGQVSKL